ncbi:MULTISPECIES: phenylalanyl-tRNA synthetase subunit alpha [unclassified Photobacterium]|uniref:phenylalanyl-tRNA synthetase subunit alpha n=1 Tax=unclassified Photobacterium TaxID=2628852 RepID=UPI001EDE41B7|nr:MULTISPECIES: phenylalanyl-tRNA synthetase subunit alpha [unclassified Photobacterium]MCG3862959.1 phenylalanyl-tRNA synthetase subunit alpha [Photobacterium sp. Ph6]MCG3874490.1 phenylalanyl-tRNA synthetase subunit alpha [Photobacterium sp. Ph5]
MKNKEFAALLKISTFAMILCTALLALGNYGLAHAMPINSASGFNIINLVFFIGLNALLVPFLAFLVKTRTRASKQRRVMA